MASWYKVELFVGNGNSSLNNPNYSDMIGRELYKANSHSGAIVQFDLEFVEGFNVKEIEKLFPYRIEQEDADEHAKRAIIIENEDSHRDSQYVYYIVKKIDIAAL